MPQLHKSTLKEKFERSGYFFGALLFHIVLFLMVATVVIWQAPPPKVDADFKAVTSIKCPPPPPKPPSAGDAAKNPVMEVDAVVIPPSAPIHTITTINENMKVDVSKSINNTISQISVPIPRGDGMTQGAGATAPGLGTSSAFGSSTASTSQLEGYLYDLKQTADRKPTNITPDQYHQVLMKFVERHWDETVLAPYYRSPKPLYTSAVLIPSMNADLGPKAFGLEKEVQPSRWVVWYKGKVSPTTPDRYRFAGICDDILLVRIDGKTVLDGSLFQVAGKPLDVPWKSNLRRGEDFTFSAAESKDIDIMIGEQPGGLFYAYLFFFPASLGNSSTLPTMSLFQIGSDFKPAPGKYPPYDPHGEPWQGGSR